MKALVARIALVVLLVLTTPAMALAVDGGPDGVWWEWFVRLITWGSGGWHGF